jgi:hypothetical protein
MITKYYGDKDVLLKVYELPLDFSNLKRAMEEGINSPTTPKSRCSNGQKKIVVSDEPTLCLDRYRFIQSPSFCQIAIGPSLQHQLLLASLHQRFIRRLVASSGVEGFSPKTFYHFTCSLSNQNMIRRIIQRLRTDSSGAEDFSSLDRHCNSALRRPIHFGYRRIIRLVDPCRPLSKSSRLSIGHP